MIYNSFNFIILFPLIFFLYYLIPAKYQVARNLFLLVVSYLLYLNWKPAYAIVLLGVTATTFISAKFIERVVKYRKSILLLGGGIALAPLLFFKYFNFINEQVYEVLLLMGMRYELQGLNWAIPIGISFFTFQALGYLYDVYKKHIEPEEDFLTYSLFISFFPFIIAGPINKASLLIPQIKNKRRPYFDYQKAVIGLKMILWGMFMKVVVADRVALYADTIFCNYMSYSGGSCFLASIMYTTQIYADFAGYSLMAIGVGKTLGFDFTENFRRPYFAISVTDFWRRWHISLSTWLKDYVYIPLGGSRCSKGRCYWNIFITFLVSGIWHGASWTFIVWGIWHGLAQIVEKMLGQQNCNYGWFGKSIKIIVTFLLVNFAWIFFRMPTISDAMGVITRIFDTSLPFNIYCDKQTFMYSGVAFAFLFTKELLDEFYPNRFQILNSKYWHVRWMAYIFLVVMILSTGVFGADQFIYASF